MSSVESTPCVTEDCGSTGSGACVSGTSHQIPLPRGPGGGRTRSRRIKKSGRVGNEGFEGKRPTVERTVGETVSQRVDSGKEG